MKSPFEDIDAAFDPMFDESIVLSHCGETQTIQASVFLDNTADPITGDAMETDREEIYIVCKPQDWGYVSQLARGDKVERIAFGTKYKVTEAKRDAVLGWCIHARSI